MPTGRRVDRHKYMTKLIAAFHSFANVPKTETPTRLFKVWFMFSLIDLQILRFLLGAFYWPAAADSLNSVLDTVMPSSVINIKCHTFVYCFMETHQFVEWFYVYCFLGTFANFEKWPLALSCLSAHPHGITWFPLDGLSWNLIFEYSLEICPENWSSIKIWQK
jgi:hypothetical protein